MARVTYGSFITELKGSIGGTSFQRNQSGNISRQKAQQRFFPSTLQSGSRSDFAKIATSWSTLDLSVQALWDTYAALHPITDRWGNIRTLTGFQLYMQSNLNLLSLGLTLLASPPVYVAPAIVPPFSATGFSNSLHLNFYPAINFPNSDLVIYATAPTTSGKLTNRKNLYLIGGFSSPNASIFDITTMYSQTFGVTWPDFFDNSNCNIIFQLMLVNRVTGVASPFTGYIFPIRNSPKPNLSTLGTSFTNLGTQAGQTILLDVTYLGLSVFLASTAATAHIMRSVNSGLTWSDLGSPFAQTGIYNFADDGNGIVVCGTYSNGHIFRSIDYGLNWSDLGQISTLTDIRHLIYCGDGIFLGYCSPNGTIIKSIDYGSSWSVVTTIASGTALGSLLYLESGIVLAFSPVANIIAKSIDYGATWSFMTNSSGVLTPRNGVYIGNGIVLAGTSTAGKTIKSVDYGVNWVDNGSIGSMATIFSLLYIGYNTILAAGNPNALIYKSTNGGVSWTSLGSQFSQAVSRCLAYKNPNLLIAGTSNSALLIRSVV